jgi:hypothetical protein
VLLERFDTWACESPRCEDMRVAEPTIHATHSSCKRLRAVVPVAAGRLAISRVTGQVRFHYLKMCDSRANQASPEHSIFRVFGISVG